MAPSILLIQEMRVWKDSDLRLTTSSIVASLRQSSHRSRRLRSRLHNRARIRRRSPFGMMQQKNKIKMSFKGKCNWSILFDKLPRHRHVVQYRSCQGIVSSIELRSVDRWWTSDACSRCTRFSSLLLLSGYLNENIFKIAYNPVIKTIRP